MLLPRAPGFWLRGLCPPPAKRSSAALVYLIEAAKRNRLDQMLFFGAADDTGASDNHAKTEIRKNMLGLRTFGHYKKVPRLRNCGDKVLIHAKKQSSQGKDYPLHLSR